MIIDGKLLAQSLLSGLSEHVATLKIKGHTPTLAVILVGDDPASLAYIRQKQKAAEQIGARVVFSHQPATINRDVLRTLIETYNADSTVDGLIVQRPVPDLLGDVSDILNTISKNKDVDGFLPDSPFDVPISLAVGEILQNAYTLTGASEKNYEEWLRHQRITVIGRGETAGAPILRYLEKQDCTTSVIHTASVHPETIMKQSDIIISCVGAAGIVPASVVKPGAILISVGLWRDAEGKLRGDYDEHEIAGVALCYTPTPGGVGPVNVSCLMQNLIKACMMTKGGRI